MKRYKSTVGIILCVMVGCLALALSACGSRGAEYSRELMAIDSLAQVNPDSAWQRICDYDTALLRTADDRHYYTLLLAEASDKTYNGVPDGNALGDAAEYFMERNDRRKAMRSMFYRGLAHQETGRYGPAIITLLKGIEMTDTAEHLYRGKIYNAISETYKAVSDAPQELEYARLSLEEYQKLDTLVFIENMKLAYGYALCQNNKFDDGISQMWDVYDAVKTRNDSGMSEVALKYMALGYLWGSDNKRAKDCLTNLYSNAENKASLGEYLGLYLNSMIVTGSPSDSIEMLATVILNDSNFQGLPYEYYEYKKDYKTAYMGVKEVMHQNDSLFVDGFHSSVSHEVKEYMDEEQSKAKLRISHLNSIITWIIVSVVLLICLIVVLVRFYVVSKKKREKDLLYTLEILNKEKSEIVSRIDKLNSDNKNLLEENNSIRSEYADYMHSRQSQQDAKRQYESDLLSKLFGELDALHSEYYVHGGSENGKTVIMNRLSGQLNLLREDKELLEDMEGYINNCSDDMLAEVYESVRLNTNQRRLVALLCIGFSKEAVCQVMGIGMQSFYLRMNRLVKRIEECESPERNELLAILRREKRLK